MLLKKRQVLTATLIIALCAALAANWYFIKPDNSTIESTDPEEAVTGNLGDTLFVAGTTAKDDETITSESSEEKTVFYDDHNEYFSDAKLKRTQSYDEVIENINQILSKDELADSEKNKISIMLSDYQRDMKTQTDIENLISAKTGNECLVVINGEACQVILQKNTLNDALILQISEIIEKNTDIFSENLTIIELK